MRWVRVLVGIGCALTALGVLLAAWVEDAPALDRDDATAVALRSLEAIGFDEVEVSTDPRPETYEPTGGGPEIPVWRTVSVVEDGTVELWVARSDGAAVYLLDRTTDGTGQLFTDEQFEALSRLRITPTEDRHLRRNIVATVAAAAVVLVSAGLLTATSVAPTQHPPSTRPLRAVRRSFRR